MDFSMHACKIPIELPQLLSGRVLDSRPWGRGFGPHRRHCVVVLKQDAFNIPNLVLVQPRKTHPCLTKRLLMGRKESNKTSMHGSRNFCQGGGGGPGPKCKIWHDPSSKCNFWIIEQWSVWAYACPSLLCSHMQYSPYYNQVTTNLAFCLLAMSSAGGKHFGPRSGPREDQDWQSIGRYLDLKCLTIWRCSWYIFFKNEI